MSLNVRQRAMDKNKSFEFVKLYKSAAESKDTQLETGKMKKVKKMKKKSQSELNTSNGPRSPSKIAKKKSNGTLHLSHIEGVVGHNTCETITSKKNSSTSTTNSKDEFLDNSVKSIMKNKSNNVDSELNTSVISSSHTKPKKRNKSVSFMLEDAEEVIVKKSKSNNSDQENKSKGKELKNKEKEAKSKIHKQKKKHQTKENLNFNEDMECSNKENVTSETMKNKVIDSTSETSINKEVLVKKKKAKKNKRPNSECENSVDDVCEDTVTGELSSENKTKKIKKKKRKIKSTEDGNTDNAEGEPAVKTRKKDLKPEVIAKGLQNLKLGDNAHTLTHLLDDMIIMDKNAKKKERQKLKRNKKKLMAPEDTVGEPQNSNNVEEKEKVKWINRKWNKDAKGDGKYRFHISVVVENLPIKIMCNYKKLLSEQFSKFGSIAGIGVAEAYPTEDLKPVFTTTVFFQEEEAVAKALAEDNTVLGGSRIRVRRPLPPTETTLVAHAYGLSEQALSSLFSGAGRVRSIRQLVKGKKSMPTAFVEFDGPEAVERALKIAEDAKINGKKMYVSKFEIRNKNKNNSSNGATNDNSKQ